MTSQEPDPGPPPRRSIWSGSISIGLVNVPVTVNPLVRDHSVSFRMLHRKDNQPIRYERVCEHDREVVPWEDVVRGYEVRQGEYLVFDRSELEAIRPESDRRIRIDRFVYSLSLDPVYFNTSYLLLPDRNPEAYALLLGAFRKLGRAGVGRITLRTKEYPALIREYRDALILTTLHYSDEVADPRESPRLQGLQEPGEKELELAVRIVEELSGDLDLSEYHDRYREQVEDLVRKKLEGETVKIEKPKAEEARDLMAALQETLARMKAGKQ
jgi:DNA end-binding protein Ku